MRLKALASDCCGWIDGRRHFDPKWRVCEGYTVQGRRSGQALAEFALVAPLLVLMVMGIVDLGRVFYTYEALANAAREGARYCARHAHDTSMNSTTTNYLSTATTARVTGELDSTVSNVTVYGSASNQPSCDTSIQAGSNVTVTAATNFWPVTPLIGQFAGSGGTIPITAQATALMS